MANPTNAFEVSYAGQALRLPTQEVCEKIERMLPQYADDIFDPSVFSCDGLGHLPIPHINKPPIKLGTWYYPTGASRFSYYFGLATQDEMTAIGNVVFPGSGPVAAELTLWTGALTLSDGSNQQTPQGSMYCLPPKIAFNMGGDNKLWLLTLVDERYFWWFRSSDITVGVASNSCSWTVLLQQIADAMGLTCTDSFTGAGNTPHSDYGKPTRRWNVKRQPLPPLLDAAAYACGMRVFRNLSDSAGVVRFQNYSEAETTQSAEVLKAFPVSATATPDYIPVAGGDSETSDVKQWIPATVSVVLDGSELAAGSGYTSFDTDGDTSIVQNVTLSSLALSEFSGVTGFTGKKVIYGDKPEGGSPTNAAYAQRVATDWYKWQLGGIDVTLQRLVSWSMSGLVDSVEWTVKEGCVQTRVKRGPWLDKRHGRWHDGTNLPGALIKVLPYTGNLTSGSAVVGGMSTTTGITAGQSVEGTGIPLGTTVSSVDSGTQITMSANATITSTGAVIGVAGFYRAERYLYASADVDGPSRFHALSRPCLAANIARAYSGSGDAGVYHIIEGMVLPAIQVDVASDGKPVFFPVQQPLAMCSGSGASDPPTPGNFPVGSRVSLSPGEAWQFDGTGGEQLFIELLEMLGATGSTDGRVGLVPRPLMGDEGDFLRGDGTWSMPPAQDFDGGTW